MLNRFNHKFITQYDYAPIALAPPLYKIIVTIKNIIVIFYLIYGVLLGMWNLQPGSKSSLDLATGGDIP